MTKDEVCKRRKEHFTEVTENNVIREVGTTAV